MAHHLAVLANKRKCFECFFEMLGSILQKLKDIFKQKLHNFG